MRKWSKIIYSGNGWDMTVRELMFSIVIILIMLMGGFFISEKIASHNDEQNQEYYQAMQIDGNAELFQYGMRTDVGNAFVKGNLVAVDPVTDPGIGGVPAAYIKVEEQHYNRHTRQVAHTRTVNGKTQTYYTTEVYYSWITTIVGKAIVKRCHSLAWSFVWKIQMPGSYLYDTIKQSSHVRYLYYVINTGIQRSYLCQSQRQYHRGRNTVHSGRYDR